MADTNHALTSDRPYRKGMLHANAVSIIRALRGTQLCPLYVDAFIAWAKVLHPPFRRAKPKP